MGARVEICVSDNASSDGTADMITSWEGKLHIKYFCFNENQGADANYLKVTSMATGKYLWMIGSDDQVVVGGITEVLRYIETYSDTGVFLFGRDEYDITLTYLKNRTHWLNRPLLRMKSFDFSIASDRLSYFNQVADLGGIFSYISSIIIRRDAWHSQTIDTRFIGTAYSHVYMIMSSLLCSSWNQLRVCPYVPVNARLGNDSFFQTNRQRLMLDVNGYKLLADSLLAPGEHSAFYTPLRATLYLEFPNNTIRDHHNEFSISEFRRVFVVCGPTVFLKNWKAVLKTVLKEIIGRCRDRNYYL